MASGKRQSDEINNPEKLFKLIHNLVLPTSGDRELHKHRNTVILLKGLIFSQIACGGDYFLNKAILALLCQNYSH